MKIDIDSEKLIKIRKLISKAMDDTRTICNSSTRCADDLNMILEHTTNEIVGLLTEIKGNDK